MGGGTWRQLCLNNNKKKNKRKKEWPSLTNQKQQMLVRMWRKGNPSALLVGMQTGAATVENNMEFPQKTKNSTAF